MLLKPGLAKHLKELEQKVGKPITLPSSPHL
jgi:hypothetical protein